MDESRDPQTEPNEADAAKDAQAATDAAAATTTMYERRAFLGGMALLVRTAVAQLIILGGQVVLARRLSASEFGAFAMIQFALTALTVFGDGGLGGALIQKKEVPTQRELSSVFFVQLGLGALVVALAFIVGPGLQRLWPDLPEGTPWIVLALAMNFVMTSLRVVPMLLMERELRFVRVAILDTVNSIAFYLVASVLALRGYGIWALCWGVFAQGVLSFVGANLLRPWLPSFVFDAARVRTLLAFGVPFQSRNALGIVMGAVIPVVGGTMLGSQAVGRLNWAHQNGFFPLTFVDIIARVSFPLYSRLRDQEGALQAALERSVRLCTAISLFIATMFIGLAPQLTEIIFSSEWLPAVPLLRIYAGAIAFGMLVNVLSPALDAVGKPRVAAFQVTVVAVCTWVVVPFATQQWGIVGFAVAFNTVLLLGTALMILLAHKYLASVTIALPFVAPAIAGIVNAVVGLCVLGPRIESGFGLAGSVLVEIAIYVGIVGLLDRSTLRVLLAALPGGTKAESTSA